MSGSRLPVGSSAMIRRGSWTRARAMAVRCCSPPDSWAGIWRACAVSPTSARTRSTAGRDPAARRARHLQREGDVLPDRLGGEQLEVLEDDPDLAAHLRDLAARQPGEVLAVEHDGALRRDLVADEELDQRRLAGARRADEEDEVAFRDHEVDVAERLLAVVVLLRDVVQHEDRALLRRLLVGAAKDAFAKRARGGRGWGEGQGRLRGWLVRRHASPTRASRTPSAGTARGATCDLRLSPAHGRGKRDGGHGSTGTMVRSGAVRCAR